MTAEKKEPGAVPEPLREALERIAEPIKWEQEHLAADREIDWPILMHMLNKPAYYQRVAREALSAAPALVQQAPAPLLGMLVVIDPEMAPDQIELRDRGRIIGRIVGIGATPGAVQPAPTSSDVASDLFPCVRITVQDGKIISASLYAPGLPDGEFNVYPLGGIEDCKTGRPAPTSFPAEPPKNGPGSGERPRGGIPTQDGG